MNGLNPKGAVASDAVPPVLIVEDDRAVAEAITDMLRYYGLKSTVASSLFEASQFLRFSMPRCALIDLGLPDGNGVQLIRRLRSTGLGTAIAVLTNAIDRETTMRVQASKPDIVFNKPLVMLDVVNFVRGATQQEKKSSRVA
jgi:DNA-binding response OmpR family regulator